MKRILFTLLLMAQVLGLRAQTLSGRVVDGATGQPVPYATISLMNADSTLLAGAITDENGLYSLEWRVESESDALRASESEFIMSASFVGYETQYRVVESQKSKVESYDFVLHETTAQLEEVEMSAKRPLVERVGDKIVMNVSESPFAIGSNGVEILKKAPGVMVDKDGNITVNGKSVEVYIDGRPSYMSGAQLNAMLTGSNGTMIEKLEIITNPSAKYDASGQGGIINIKLKRNKMRGFNGILSANYGGMYFKDVNRFHSTENVYLNLNYRTAKTYTNITLIQAYNDLSYSPLTQNRQPVGVEGQEPKDTLSMRGLSQYEDQSQYYSLRVSNDWYIDSVNTFGFIANIPFFTHGSGTDDTSKMHSYIKYNKEYLQYVATKGRQSDYGPQHTFNLNFTHVFCDSLSRELTVNADYIRFYNQSLNSQRNFAYVDVVSPYTHPVVPGLDIDSKQYNNIADAKLDFQTRFWQSGMLEAGVKYVYSGSVNRMVTDSILAKETHQSTNDFNYDEHVAAAYVTASKQWEKVTAKLGLRGEYTYSLGNWISSDTMSRYSYFNLFPTAFVSYTPAEKWSMSLSYTRRIKRPSYYQLNPFVTYLDPHTLTVGNPALKPEFNHQVDLNFGWSQYVSLAFNFSHTQDMLNQKAQVMPYGDQQQMWVNFGTCTTHGGMLGLTELPLVPKFDEEHKVNGAWLALTVNASYFNFISRGQADYVQRHHWAQVYGSLTGYLPKDIQMSVDGRWNAPMVIGYQRHEGNYGINFAFKKTWKPQQVTLSVQVSDILRSDYTVNETILGLGEGYYSNVYANLNMQRVSIGVTWLFGQQQFQKQRKVGVSDEASRLGSGSGIGK